MQIFLWRDINFDEINNKDSETILNHFLSLEITLGNSEAFFYVGNSSGVCLVAEPDKVLVG